MHINKLNDVQTVEHMRQVGAFNVAARPVREPDADPRVRIGKTRRDKANGTWDTRFEHQAKRAAFTNSSQSTNLKWPLGQPSPN